MPVTLNTQGIHSEDDIGGTWLSVPGMFHVMVKDVKEEDEAIIIQFEVLDGTVPGQRGKTIKEWFSLSEKAIGRLTKLALVTDLIKPDGEQRDVDFADAIGRQLVIKAIEDHYTTRKGEEKTRVKCEFAGFWRLGHKDVSDVPIDQEIAESGVVTRTDDGGTAATAAASDDSEDWDDLDDL